VSLSLLVPLPSAVAARSIRPRWGESFDLPPGPDIVPFALVAPRAAGDVRERASSSAFRSERLLDPLGRFVAITRLLS